MKDTLHIRKDLRTSKVAREEEARNERAAMYLSRERETDRRYGTRLQTEIQKKQRTSCIVYEPCHVATAWIIHSRCASDIAALRGFAFPLLALLSLRSAGGGGFDLGRRATSPSVTPGFAAVPSSRGRASAQSLASVAEYR